MTPTKAKPDGALAGDVEPDDELLTRREAAERAGVHYNTIRLWEGQRRLTPVRIKVGRREEIRIRAGQLEKVAAERAEAQPAAKAGALAIPADQLWGMVQQAGADLAQALEAKARAEVEAAMRAQALEREQSRADAAEARNTELTQALTAAMAAGKRWWRRG